ncbi:unnamed protein product [Paramecium pentaurelia]|uniref:TRAF3-interacting protein 1 n=1 Tax=Paramecium pentaurelia TaxID=43138 RepID=A0A8S1X0C1_9CILI|nr:unnamed protein product [Paramecium pentaurelia]
MGDFWKPTAELYSALFEKPKMSQKLLEKPPFKYIFDIIMETTKQTGYAKGLYTNDELDGNSYDNKDKKLLFLQKIIDLTQMMLKEEIAAKPTLIVIGLEPENTNFLLQTIYRAAVSGKNSKIYVEQVLAKIGACPKEIGQVQEHNKKPEQLNSINNLQPQSIIEQQQQLIYGLENEIKQKDAIIINLEQQIQALKSQLKQITKEA